jgi:adenine-specific DNA-methyltransferase
VDFDTTQNLYIEGDNLDALKLLQETYLNQVKMIYIDPPYNTGNDFIYEDDFAEDTESYKLRSNQADEDGNRLVANTESNGRFHSDWLSMMYSRLKLARNLLKDDGVIFISIDDNEQANLKRLCDEVFGEDNFIAEFIWKKKQGGGNDSRNIVIEHEYILCFSKSIENINFLLDSEHILDDALYPFKDEKGEYGLVTLDKSSIRFSDSLVFEIKSPDGTSYIPRIIKGKQSCWRWGKDKVSKDYDQLVFKNSNVYTKYYRPDGSV